MKEDNKHIKLEELDKKVYYDAPDEYFDKLPYAIQEKIHTKQTIWGHFTELPLFIKWAPVPLAFIITAFFIWNTPTNDPQTFQELLSEVTNEEILEYLYLEDFSTYEIVLSMDKYDSIAFDTDVTETWLNKLSDEELNDIFKNYNYDTSLQYY